MKHFKIDPASIVAHTEWEPRAPVRINETARCTLFFFHARIPVVRLKIIPEKSLPQLHPEIFKLRKCPHKRPLQKLRIYFFFQNRRNPEYTA